ncbi:MAG: PhoH family protein [Thermodesulfobacteriota bacterium]
MDTSIQTNETTKELELENSEVVKSFYGELNGNLKEIENLYGVKVHSRGTKLVLKGPGDKVGEASELIKSVYELVEKGYSLDPGDVELASRILKENKSTLEEIFLDTVCVSIRKKLITPKSINQKIYIDAIRKNDIVFGIGPAGTGKTYLAMSMAVSAFLNKKVTRIILARPAVEAGEKLGFLPGDLYQKVDPYLRPLFDALYEMMDIEKASRLIEKGVIEIVPLAFMRGRTLNDAFVILDEAQNTTSTQMKMFLTRLGFSSKAVITGDKTQVDLSKDDKSGLMEAESLLRDINGIGFVYFNKSDVVRHPLVRKIIEAYENPE